MTVGDAEHQLRVGAAAATWHGSARGRRRFSREIRRRGPTDSFPREVPARPRPVPSSPTRVAASQQPCSRCATRGPGARGPAQAANAPALPGTQARMTNGGLIKKITEAMKDLVTEANFDCSTTGLSVQAMVRHARDLFPARAPAPRSALALRRAPSAPPLTGGAAQDSSHVSLVALLLRAEGFEHFRCDRSTSLGINLGSMGKASRRLATSACPADPSPHAHTSPSPPRRPSPTPPRPLRRCSSAATTTTLSR